MLPTISVVTPSYNQAVFIERTIQSVLAQGVPDLEYVVIDGGSTDGTLDILRKYDGQFAWLSERDNGQADAVNKGIRITTGQIIGWLNSDDIFYPGSLLSVISFFAENPGVDVVYGDADHIDESDNVIEPYYTEDWDYERLREICFLCQPAVFFRRRLTERMGLLKESLRYCMDYEYWLRLGAIIPFVHLKTRLAGSRMYADNKTLGARVAVHREINDMLQTKFGAVPARWLLAYAHAVVNQKGYDRAHSLDNLKYVWSLLRVSAAAFVHWKPEVSATIIRKVRNCCRGKS